MRLERACMAWERKVDIFKKKIAMEGVEEVKKGRYVANGNGGE